MALNSKIEWTRHTWNPMNGCRKVSAGCKFCYAERFVERFNTKGQPKKHDFAQVKRASEKAWGFPYTEHKKIDGTEPFTERLVFTCSMSDWFISEADEYRSDLWRIIKETPNLIYQILTKRADRIAQCLPDDWGEGYANVWLGVSAENQEMYDLRVPKLLDVPAHVRFVSVEPIIGPVDINTVKGDRQPDWIIIGGESGNKTGRHRYRAAETVWFYDIVKACKEKGIAPEILFDAIEAALISAYTAAFLTCQ